MLNFDSSGGLIDLFLNKLSDLNMYPTSNIYIIFVQVGGAQLFIQQFIAEVHAIVSAHVLALGGNAILSFHINEVLLINNSQKNEVRFLNS